MPKTPACTGAPAYGAPVQVSFTYPALDETTGLTTALPTSEPGSAQISYTAGATHLPTTNIGVSYSVTPFLWVGCQNTSGTTRTISYRLEKNGTSILTGTTGNIANNSYGNFSFTAGALSATAPAVGDAFTVKLWASGAGVTLQQHAFMLSPCCLLKGGNARLVMLRGYSATPLVRETTAAGPTGGTNTAYGMHYYTAGTGADFLVSGSTSVEGSCSLPVGVAHPTCGVFYGYWDNRNVSANFYGYSTAYYATQKRVKTFTYLPLNIPI